MTFLFRFSWGILQVLCKMAIVLLALMLQWENPVNES